MQPGTAPSRSNLEKERRAPIMWGFLIIAVNSGRESPAHRVSPSHLSLVSPRRAVWSYISAQESSLPLRKAHIEAVPQEQNRVICRIGTVCDDDSTYCADGLRDLPRHFSHARGTHL